MKRKFTKLLAAFALLVFMTPNMVAWGQTRTETLKYTLDGTITGGSSGYATESDITQNSISWKVMGNTTMNPWRIGGSSLSGANRTIYSTTAIIDNISKITIEHGNVSSITVNSMTVTIHSTAADAATGSNAIASFNPTFAANNTVTITKSDNTSWANCFYRVVYNLTTTGSGNKYLQFKNAKFYEISGGSDPSITISGDDISNNAASFAYNNTSSHVATVTCQNFSGTPNPTIGVYTDLECTTAYTGSDFSAAFAANSTTTVNYGFTTANNSTTDARTLYMRASEGEVNSNVVTVTQAKKPVTYTTISDLFNGATDTETPVLVTFNNWVVSGVSTNGKNVFVTDGTNGFIIYFTTDMSGTFSAGKILSGTEVLCKLKLYNGAAELINVNAADLTIADGGTLTPANVALADLTGINTGALLSYENLICTIDDSGNTTKYYLTDGTTSIQLYNLLFAFTNPTAGNHYNVAGVYQQYNTIKEIMPRNANDLTPYVGPTLSIPTAPINLTSTGGNGSLNITYSNLTISSTENFGVTFYAEDGTTPLTTNIPTWVGQSFTGNSTDGYKFNYNISNYTGTEDRVARLKVYGMDDDLIHEAYSELLTITQAAPVPTYAVIFNLDGGTFVPNADFASDAVDKEAGTYALPSATKTGTNFAGWKNDDTDVVYASGANYEVTDDVSFTAQWSNSATVTYTITSTSSVSTTGTAPVGSTAVYTQTHSTVTQMTSGNSMTLTLSGYQGRIVKGITLSMKSNTSGGGGYMSATAGTTTLASIEDAKFNTASWYGDWSTSFVDIEPTLSNSNYIIQGGEDLVINIAATANSLFCESFTIEYETSDQPIVAVTPATRTLNYQTHNSATENLDFAISSLNIASPSYQIAFCDENGNVLSSNPNAWFSPALSGSTLSFTTTQNGDDDRTAYFKVYAVAASEPVYSTLCSVTQTHEPYTYSKVTSADGLISGKHYLLVSEGSTKNYAMGEQKSNNRDAIEVTITTGTITETTDVYEFVISGDDVNHWTIYDKANSGYLYTSNNSNARLQNQTDNDVNGEWSIVFDNDGNATIKTYGHDKYNIIMLNGSLFSCYSSTYTDGKKVQLYIRDNDKDYEFYSPTTLASANIANNETYTVQNGGLLNVTSSITGSSTTNLIIEDGGQVKSNNAFHGTMKKNITGYGAGNEANKANYYLMGAPVTVFVNALVPGGEGNYDKSDVYWFDGSYQGGEWRWAEIPSGASATMVGINYHGFLFAYQENCKLSIVSSTAQFPATGTDIAANNLSNSTSTTFGKYNLIGNPYTCNAYVDRPYYRMNTAGDGFTAATASEPIKPLEGVFIVFGDTETANKVTFTTTDPASLNAGSNNGTINITASQMVATRGNSSDVLIDRAIVNFGEGQMLPKFTFQEGTTKLYIPQGNKDYAVVNTEARGEMPVNFKAAEDGTYTISVEAENLDVNYLHLIDNKTGMDVDLLATPSYTFEGKRTDYASRFRLVFDTNAGNNETSEEFAFISDGNIVIVNDGEATLQVIDMLGRIVSSQTVNGNASIDKMNANGVYVLRLINGNNVKTQKIVVK